MDVSSLWEGCLRCCHAVNKRQVLSSLCAFLCPKYSQEWFSLHLDATFNIQYAGKNMAETESMCKYRRQQLQQFHCSGKRTENSFTQNSIVMEVNNV